MDSGIEESPQSLKVYPGTEVMGMKWHVATASPSLVHRYDSIT